MWLFDQKGGFPVPTQEERLSAFEQTVTALSRDIKDINHNETLLLGMSMKQGEDIREIRSNLASMSMKQGEDIREIRSSLAPLGERLDTFDGRLDTFDGRLDTFDGRLDTFGGRLDTFGERLDTIDQSVNSRFEAQDKKLDQVLLLLNTLTAKPGQE
jgi:chromosome segregation ATPase